MKPPRASGWAMRSSSMPSTISSDTSLPASMTAFACRPSGVPAFTAARSRSPVETCGTLSSALSSAAWVPLPEPFGPKKTIRICPVFSLVWWGHTTTRTSTSRRQAIDFPRDPSAKLAAPAPLVKPPATMSKGNLLYAQSGGVTAVINATACAVIESCRKYKIKAYAARNGIIGALREELVDLSKEDRAQIGALRWTPGGAFGSCRFKLKSLDADRQHYERLIEVLR